MLRKQLIRLLMPKKRINEDGKKQCARCSRQLCNKSGKRVQISLEWSSALLCVQCYTWLLAVGDIAEFGLTFFDTKKRVQSMLAQVYNCPKCGETIDAVTKEEFVDDLDEIYCMKICERCGSELSELTHNGKPVMQIIKPERAWWESGEQD